MANKSATDVARAFLKGLEGQEISVGWFPGNVYAGSGTPVAFVAFVNEYGGKRGDVEIPARAPMRITGERHMNEIRDLMREAIRAGVMGRVDASTALDRIGLFAQSKLQDTIGSNLPTPNAESTVEGMLLRRRNPDGSYEEYRAGSAQKENRTFGQGKGFNRTLVDTGQLMNTVSFTVTKEGS